MNTQKEMKIKKVNEAKDKISILTTGAEYVIDKSGKSSTISCYQGLGKKRLVAIVDFNRSLPTLSVERTDDSMCVLHQNIGGDKGGGAYLRLQINGDSLLEIYSCVELALSFTGNFQADYNVQKNGHVLLIDETGGIGIYPYQGLNHIEFTNCTQRKWKIRYGLNAYCQLFLSVFPSRPFNYVQAFEEKIVHHSTWPQIHPIDKMIEKANKYANILVLHDGIWRGKYDRAGKLLENINDIYENSAYCCFDYVAVNEKELTRVVKKSHSLGMKVIPYMSPFYSMAKGDDFLFRVKHVLEKYGFDGVYYDGISMDILYSYQMIKKTRELLKDKILYVHLTSDPLSENIYCPFIDTYADYILRAEHITGFDDKYLRYVLSGYNISNTIGYICYYDYPLYFIKKIIAKALRVNARFSLGMPETEREKVLQEYYFPKLEKMYYRTKKQ